MLRFLDTGGDAIEQLAVSASGGEDDGESGNTPSTIPGSYDNPHNSS